jgi:hypothetical protein
VTNLNGVAAARTPGHLYALVFAEVDANLHPHMEAFTRAAKANFCSRVGARRQEIALTLFLTDNTVAQDEVFEVFGQPIYPVDTPPTSEVIWMAHALAHTNLGQPPAFPIQTSLDDKSRVSKVPPIAVAGSNQSDVSTEIASSSDGNPNYPPPVVESPHRPSSSGSSGSSDSSSSSSDERAGARRGGVLTDNTKLESKARKILEDSERDGSAHNNPIGVINSILQLYAADISRVRFTSRSTAGVAPFTCTLSFDDGSAQCIVSDEMPRKAEARKNVTSKLLKRFYELAPIDNGINELVSALV